MLAANGTSQATFALTVKASSNDTLPSRVTLNGVPCTLLVQEVAGQEEARPAPYTPLHLPRLSWNQSQSLTELPLQVVQQYLTTSDGEVIGPNGTPLDLKGLAW